MLEPWIIFFPIPSTIKTRKSSSLRWSSPILQHPLPHNESIEINKKGNLKTCKEAS
jgi:hypothetical protein